MDPKFPPVLIAGYVLGLLIATPLAYFVGRQKHIGGWWSFVVVFFSMPFLFIPGIIMVILSPSARKDRTPFKEWILVLGFLSIVSAVGFYISYITNAFSTNTTEAFGLSFAISHSVLGLYLIWLGSGKVVNHRPKFRENTLLNWMRSLNLPVKNLSVRSSPKTASVHERLYYIVEEGMPVGPFALQQVKDKQLKAGTLVCRNGEQNWSAVEEIKELYPYVIFPPPPIVELPPIPEPIESTPVNQIDNFDHASNNRSWNLRKKLIWSAVALIGVFIFCFVGAFIIHEFRYSENVYHEPQSEVIESSVTDTTGATQNTALDPSGKTGFENAGTAPAPAASSNNSGTQSRTTTSKAGATSGPTDAQIRQALINADFPESEITQELIDQQRASGNLGRF
ncbi:MAG: DUF4339 domain-containing protein [Bacteroidota bacterium]|jgi:hypothetical protein